MEDFLCNQIRRNRLLGHLLNDIDYSDHMGMDYKALLELHLKNIGNKYCFDFRKNNIWLLIFYSILSTLNRGTEYESIATHAWRTTAHRNMVEDIAYGTLSTSVDTRINAFITNTSLIRGTISIENTLGSTSSIRISFIFG